MLLMLFGPVGKSADRSDAVVLDRRLAGNGGRGAKGARFDALEDCLVAPPGNGGRRLLLLLMVRFVSVMLC